MLIRITFIIFLLAFYFPIKAQFQLGISVGGLGYHPIEEKNSDFYKWKLDKKGKLVAYSGISVFVSYRINEYVGAKLQQSIVFYDCAGKFAGITHFGINLYDDIIGFKSKTDEFSVSFGPFWYYRKNWNTIDGYFNNPDFNKLSKNNSWETKFVWHGGQVEYSRKVSEELNATINVLPGYPYFYTFGLGIQNR